MKHLKLAFIPLILLCTSCASCYDYGRIGVGYKLKETNIYYVDDKTSEVYLNDPITARFELGKQCNKYSVGVSHHSQYFTGKPFNNKQEYSKTELFIDYTFDLNDIKTF